MEAVRGKNGKNGKNGKYPTPRDHRAYGYATSRLNVLYLARCTTPLLADANTVRYHAGVCFGHTPMAIVLRFLTGLHAVNGAAINTSSPQQPRTV